MIDCDFDEKCENCCFYECVTTKTKPTFVCTHYGVLIEEKEDKDNSV